MERGRRFISLLLLLLVNAVAGLDPIVVGGNQLWRSVGRERFFVQGVSYGYSTENGDVRQWDAALDLMLNIKNINTIRIHQVSPPISSDVYNVNASYTMFMDALSALGIYAIIPLTPPEDLHPWQECVLNPDGVPGNDTGRSCYPACLLTYAQAVINHFSQFNNTLAYVVGDDIMSSQSRWDAAPCVKGLLRDVKAYMRSCAFGMRVVPVMYAAFDNDMPDIKVDRDSNARMKADYLACGDDPLSQIDIFGVNVDTWCSNQSTFNDTRYSGLSQALRDFPAPLIFSEYGCGHFSYDNGTAALGGQRTWGEVASIFSSNLTNDWSGGVAFTYGVDFGDGYALFSNGSEEWSGSPGYVKSCGYPGICNVDSLSLQLGQIRPVTSKAVGLDICRWAPADFTPRHVSCPTVPAVNLSMPVSRECMPGYVSVSCAIYPMSPLEKAISACSLHWISSTVALSSVLPSGHSHSSSSSTGDSSPDQESSLLWVVIPSVGGFVVLSLLVFCCYRYVHKKESLLTQDAFDTTYQTFSGT